MAIIAAVSCSNNKPFLFLFPAFRVSFFFVSSLPLLFPGFFPSLFSLLVSSNISFI
jgi:hypothetical protein